MLDKEAMEHACDEDKDHQMTTQLEVVSEAKEASVAEERMMIHI